MNKKLQILGVFFLGFICAMVYNYFYNMNGRYIPIRTKYRDVKTSVLDTRTGKIYFEVIENDIKFYSVIDIVDQAKETQKKDTKKENK